MPRGIISKCFLEIHALFGVDGTIIGNISNYDGTGKRDDD